MTSDWGFYYTFTTNLKRVAEYIQEFPSISEEQGKIISTRISDLLAMIEDTPKSLKWKIRAKVGTRKIWYQEVSEKERQF